MNAPSTTQSPPRPSPRAQRRRERVWSLYCQGTTPASIARELKVALKIVTADIAACQQQWRESSGQSADVLLAEQLAKIDLAEREAWQAWHNSRKDSVSTKAATTGDTKRAEKTTRSQFGNPRYLQAVLECVKHRTALLGINTPRPGSTLDNLTDEELADYARRLGLDSPHWRDRLFRT